ncbi:hypothetical protein JCM21900_002528 [Sporobolomyces salmonicolor]
MWTSGWVLLAVASARCAVGLGQPREYLDALKQFQDGWVNPAATVEKGCSDILADDIVGRVDVTTTFEGNELNVKYFFGFFGEIRKDNNTTSIIGYPASQEVQALVVEPPIVYCSAVVQLAYTTMEYSFPIQIDMTTEWNDESKMMSYDAVFRRWPQAYNYPPSSSLPSSKANSDGIQSCPATPAGAVGGFFRLEDNEAMRKLIQREQMQKMDVRDGGFDRDAVEP